MSPFAPGTVGMTAGTFLADPHAARYADVVLRDHRDAFVVVLSILNDPEQQGQLVAAERYDRPALSGIARDLEADDRLALALPSLRFRQAVGVAVRLAMEGMGWSTTGRKGPVRGATHFKRAKRYEPPPEAPTGAERPHGARAALEAVTQIGDEKERAQTGSELLEALAGTRHAENRPF